MTSPLPDRAVEIYSSTGWLWAGVQLIPFGIGGAIDVLVTTRGAALVERRLTAFIEELRGAAERLGEEKVDRAFLDTEEWDDLVIRAMRSAADTRDREKIRLYAALLVGAAATDRDRDVDLESLLSAIAELSPLEIRLARSIYEMQKLDVDRDLELTEVVARGWGDPAKYPAEAMANLTFHLKRLERTGLVSEITGAYWDYTGGAYRVTMTFRRLMRYLERRSATG